MGKLQRLSSRSQGFVGALTLLCGFLMMWGSSRGTLENTSTTDRLRREAVDIDPLLPSVDYNGALVVAAGRLYSASLLEDEFLKPSHYLTLKRHVEMYQWVEERNSIDPLPKYTLAWREEQVDFFQFQKPQGHANPLLPYSSETLHVPEGAATFGLFDATRILQSVRRLLPAPLSSEMLKNPTMRIEDGKLYIPRDTEVDRASPSLGDVRVWYEGLPQGEYTILARQVDERNLVGANSANSVEIRAGLYSADELFSLEEQNVQKTNDGLLFIGGALFCFGLFSVLLPTARHIDLRPRLNVQGPIALLIVCLGLSMAAVFVFFVLGRLF